MLKPLASLWQALDELPGGTAVCMEWRLRLKDDWPDAAFYLKRTGNRATELACPSPGGDGCPRKIVQVIGNGYHAVCGNSPRECDPIILTGEEIDHLSVDAKKLAAAVGDMMSATPDRGRSAEGIAVHVGMHAVAAGMGIAVVLVIPGPMVETTIETLPRMDQPTVVLVPTPLSLSRECKGALLSRGHMLLVLSEIAGIDERHRLVGLEPAETLLLPLRQKLLAKRAQKATGPIWILPADASWQEFTFQFSTDTRLLVKFRGQTRAFEPPEFRMTDERNRQPNSTWVFLRVIVEHGGRLTWEQHRRSIATSGRAGKVRDETSLLRKSKQALSAALKALFGLAEEPIVARGESAYEVRFNVIDSNPRNAPARHAGA